METGKIDKNIPLPAVHSKFNFPWPDMEVGDSVLIMPDKKETIDILKLKIKGSARYYGVKTGKKFKSLINRVDNEIRVWRIE